jgi:hypothetical protein
MAERNYRIKLYNRMSLRWRKSGKVWQISIGKNGHNVNRFSTFLPGAMLYVIAKFARMEIRRLI